MVYKHVLLDTNTNDTKYRNYSTYRDRLRVPQPRPIFCTSLFRVCKEVSKEALAFFYSENSFVAAEGFFQRIWGDCYVPQIALNDPSGPTTLYPHSPLVIRMNGTKEIEEKWINPYDWRSPYPTRTIVFAAKHLGTFLARLSHANIWTGGRFDTLRPTPRAVKEAGIAFRFNLRNGENSHLQVSQRTVATIIDALGNFKEFPISPDVIEGRKLDISVTGDIDPNLADELMHSFRSPMQPSHFARDMELLLQEGNARRDDNYLLETAEDLYGFVRYVASNFQYRRLHLVDGWHDDWRKVLELMKVNAEIEENILYFKRYPKEWDCTNSFQRAIESYKGLRYSQPSNDRLAELHVLCGEWHLLRAGYHDARIFSCGGEYRRHRLFCIREALEQFRESLFFSVDHQRYDAPISQKVVEKIQQCEEKLADEEES